MQPSIDARHHSAEWWNRLDDLFEAAWALPDRARPVFLEQACADNPELATEVQSLLGYAVGDAASPRDFAAVILGAPTTVERVRETDARVGRTFANYAIEARIGAGEMGVVYRARDTVLDRPIALKFLSPALANDPTAKKRFLVEARTAAAIDHPNICTVHTVGEGDDGAPFIAMAYYEGETLKAKLKRERLSVAVAVDLVVQTAEGVRAAHESGVVHRDIKPGNIFITRQGVAKLLDFGVAKREELALTRPGTALGTPGYMSPEQLRDERVDARTDIWALGVVLFEVIASYPPFRGERAVQIVRSVLFDDPPPLAESRSDAPLVIEAVIRRAVAKNREDRQPTVSQFLAEVQAAVKRTSGYDDPSDG